MYGPLEDLNRMVERAVADGVVPFFVVVPVSRDALSDSDRGMLSELVSEIAADDIRAAVLAYTRGS